MIATSEKKRALITVRFASFILGVWVAAFVGAFENTGPGPSYPEILQYFGGHGDISVFSTIFMVGGFISAMFLSRYVRRRSVIGIFLVATLVQLTGLVICRFAPAMEPFLLGRLIQGIGEGVIVTCVFYSLSAFLPEGRMRGIGYASISAAWLLASILSPVMHAILTAPAWQGILDVLIVTSALSAILLVGGKAAASDEEEEGEGVEHPSFGAVVQLTVVTLVLFSYSQFAGLLSSLWMVVAVGVVVLAVLIYGSFNPRGVLRIRHGVRRFLFVRGVVSAVYAAGLAFASVIMIWAFGASVTQVAITTSFAAVGWTCGSVLQSNLKTRSELQLSGGLVVLSIGLLVFLVATLTTVPWGTVVGAFIAGAGIGVATNALPAFVSSITRESELAESLTGLEVVDTVTTTVVLSVLGVLVTQAINSPQPAVGIAAIYLSLAAAAVAAAVVIFRLRRR